MNFIFILAAIRLEPGRGRRGCANWNVRMWQLINRRGQTKAPPGCQTSALARAEVMYTDLIPQLCVNLNKYAQRAKSPKRTDCAHIRAQSDRQRARQTDRQTDRQPSVTFWGWCDRLTYLKDSMPPAAELWRWWRWRWWLGHRSTILLFYPLPARKCWWN